LLTDKQLERVVSHLESSTELGASGNGCPACGEDSFSVGRQLMFVPGLSSDGSLDMNGGSAYVRAICEHCSHTLFFDVVHMDAIDLGA
jgi:hypothetical protein